MLCCAILQVSVNANMQAAAAAGAPAVAALLRVAPRFRELAGAMAARKLLSCFLMPFVLSLIVNRSPSAEPLVEQHWQRVMERPAALAATVEALSMCFSTVQFRSEDLALVGDALKAHLILLTTKRGPLRAGPTCWAQRACSSMP